MKKLMLVILAFMPLLLMAQQPVDNFWTGFNAEIFGDLEKYKYVAGSVFILIGIFISWYIRASKAVKTNPKTPYYFKWSIFWLTKLPRKIISVIFNIVAGFIFMRFTNEILGFYFSMFVCFVIGLTFDNLITKLSKLNFSNIKKND